MWSAAEPCRTRTLSLEIQEPSIKKGCDGVLWRLGVCASMWNGSEAFQGEAGGLWGRGSNRGTDGQDGTWWRPPLVKWGWSELCPQHRRPFCSPEAATAPLAILVLGPAGASTAH